VNLDPGGIPVSTGGFTQANPAVTFDGLNYLVVWGDERVNERSPHVYAARVTPDGTVLDPQGIPVCTAHDYQYDLAVASGGGNSLVAWTDYYGSYAPSVYAARIAPDGTVLDPNGFQLYEDYKGRGYPSVTFGAGNYFVAWADGRNEIDLYGARVTPAGEILDPRSILINDANNWQLCSSVDFDGTNYFAVWTDGRSGVSSGVYGARVTPDGTVLDSSGIMIAQVIGGHNSRMVPTVAYDGTQHIVAWCDTLGDPCGDVYGAPVSPDGRVGDMFAIAAQPDTQAYAKLAAGNNRQILAT
jgi:hypothetical protein